jgi:hypothetical protein
MGMGNEVDLHTPHWHGKTLKVGLLVLIGGQPGGFETFGGPFALRHSAMRALGHSVCLWYTCEEKPI